MEFVINYILPNVVLFGGIYIAAKSIEAATWYFMCNYDAIIAKLERN